ncbi:MAG: hypothetical protein IT198_10670 [Acidimicrobiia bacterium]|nr:hypothetical protein [Acidimicrobiia bacterium]
MEVARRRERGRRLGCRLAAVAIVAAASAGWMPSGSVAAAPSGPEAGTYVYDVSGSTRSGIGPFAFSTPLPPTASSSLSYAGDCGVLVITTKSTSETGVYCPSDTGILALYRSVQTMTMLVWHQTTTTTCTPPVDMVRTEALPGDNWPMSCAVRTDGFDNSSFAADGTVTYVGSESLSVGGEAVEAFHGRAEITFSGARTGSMTEDVWLNADGLPLKRVVKQTTVGGQPRTSFGMAYTATLQSLAPEL